MIKKSISLILAFCIVLSSVCVFAAEDDNGVNIEDYISFISSFNIINGDPDGNYRLDNLVTRAEFSKIAVAASEQRNSVAAFLAISPFSDTAVILVKSASLSEMFVINVDGTDSTTFFASFSFI